MTEGGVQVGYTITFTKSDPVTIRNGKDGANGVNGKNGADGANGKDGATPVIGVRKDTDGIYYWTLNGDWLTDSSGKKIKAEAKDGADGQDGKDGENGKDGDSFFKSVESDDDTVIITLVDGTVFTLPVFKAAPMEFYQAGEQEINVNDNRVVVRINDDDEATYIAVVEPFDAMMSTKAAGGWKVTGLSRGDTPYDRQYLYIDICTDPFIEKVLLTVTRVAKDGSSYSLSKVLTIGYFDLTFASGEPSNCYIVESAGSYKFPSVKGNSMEQAGEVASVEVLWESFGKSNAPAVGELVYSAKFEDGYIHFGASDKKGNAVIAAKDSEGTILWSWHIWMTDFPKSQIYANSAGTMMDRNLGATSAAPGDVGSLGLLYQWGRKDPFLGSSSISSSVKSVSTNNSSWYNAVSDEINGTVECVITHPMTFIIRNSNNNDWYYTGSAETDNTRWQSEKTIYDPCPSGWRVPDGGENGIWAVAAGQAGGFNGHPFDNDKKGMNFAYSETGKYFCDEDCWYPTPGYYMWSNGGLSYVNSEGYCWSCTPSGSGAYNIRINSNGAVNPSWNSARAYALPVRCCRIK